MKDAVKIHQIVAKLARTNPQLQAVVDVFGQYSHADILLRACALVNFFNALGIKSGDVVTMQLPNWADCIAINVACSAIGAIINPVMPIYRDRELTDIFEDCQPKIVFIPGLFRKYDFAAMHKSLRKKLNADFEIVLVGDIPEPVEGTKLLSADIYQPYSGDLIELDNLLGSDTKLLMYTSGTSGRAKGVIHTHDSLCEELNAVRHFWGVGDGDVIFMPSPVTHITGFLYGLELPFYASSAVIFMDQWFAREGLELIIEHQATFCVAATPFLHELLDEIERSGESLETMQCFASGGASVPPSLIYRAYDLMPNARVFRVYGSTEAPTVTLGVSSRAEKINAAETDGKIYNFDVKICDPDTDIVLADGESGEIRVKGPELFRAYTCADATKAAFDKEGYFRTGDAGRKLPNEYLEITGRIKDLIIRGGENLSPAEIESAVIEHPDVSEVAVIGVEHHRLGEGVCACIVAQSSKTISQENLKEFLLRTGHLAKQKIPEHVVLMKELPKTPSGKVLKNQLREEHKHIII